ncbi:uncharacterized protein BJX67DRAFT_6113 [Aspergillus lucknowensis]|uniref:Uncharacterized protein n=1 Tax=Aspergillus lucknowensis TaxID=176173 RepID=A0ABR4M722_9EURO
MWAQSCYSLVRCLLGPLGRSFRTFDDDAKKHMDKILAPLSSVIDAQGTSVVVPVHQSFRDFLLDRDRCRKAPEFWINQQDAHLQLLEKCLDCLMVLKQDIFNLKAPGFRAADIPAGAVAKCLPLHMQYACRYWIEHLAHLDVSQRAQAGLEDHGCIHSFIRSKLLFWLEALSVMKLLPFAIPLINQLIVLANSTGSHSLSNFLKDGLRFVLANRQNFEQAPLQIYSSRLIFSPVKSLVRQHYSSLIPSWITLGPSPPDQWNSELFCI